MGGSVGSQPPDPSLSCHGFLEPQRGNPQRLFSSFKQCISVSDAHYDPVCLSVLQSMLSEYSTCSLRCCLARTSFEGGVREQDHFILGAPGLSKACSWPVSICNLTPWTRDFCRPLRRTNTLEVSDPQFSGLLPQHQGKPRPRRARIRTPDVLPYNLAVN